MARTSYIFLFEKKPGIGTGVVMVGILASNAVDRGFELGYVETKDYIISICCFSAKPTPLRSNIKYWLVRNLLSRSDNITNKT
jgi:hypothetical protein